MIRATKSCVYHTKSKFCFFHVEWKSHTIACYSGKSSFVSLYENVSHYYYVAGLSHYERMLGNYLSSCGELDFTLAGQIMAKTGNMHKRDAELRLKQIPSFLRLQAETITFATSGLGDLSFSIENLERARKDYRAALLWMKDVSEKLHNPDAKGQLVRFREVGGRTSYQ